MPKRNTVFREDKLILDKQDRILPRYNILVVVIRRLFVYPAGLLAGSTADTEAVDAPTFKDFITSKCE